MKINEVFGFNLRTYMQSGEVVKSIVGSQYLMALMLFPIILTITKLLEVGCADMFCSARGYAYGGSLMLACLAFGILGAFLSIVLDLFGQKDTKTTFLPTLTLWIALGQVVTMVYIYLRSAFNQFIFEIQITNFEVWAWVIIALYILNRKFRATSRSNFWENGKYSPLLIQVIVIAALCVVVADREIPRVVMLSSDPDVHAFFARQIQRFGGIPYEQHAWGKEAFNYPAGSGALVYSWSLFSFQDVRNILAALPVLLTYFSAIVIVERVSVQLQLIGRHLAVLLFVLAITAAGFLLPMYDNYSHMEGSGRQLSIIFSALFVVLCVGSISTNEMLERKTVIIISLVIFSLTVLNPVNLILPVIFLGAAILYIYLVHRRNSGLILASTVGMLLLLLDPYYTALLGISKSGSPMLELSGDMLVKSPSMWLSDTLAIYKTQSALLLSHFSGLLQSQAFPVFSVLFLSFLACMILLSRPFLLKAKVILMVALLLLALLLVDGAMMAFANDKRFYLLQPYLNFNMGQYKILLITFLGAWIVVMAFKRKIPPVAIAGICICMVTITAVSIRTVQSIRYEPRWSYCGSMGCYAQADLELLKRFEGITASGLIPKFGEVWPKVLVPNSVHQMGTEKWIFPVSSARALPFYNVIPAAFYYYQADAEYTTNAYMQHVCNNFDRSWLKTKNIQYIFLPENRDNACIAGMNLLPQSEETIIKIGESYLLKIR